FKTIRNEGLYYVDKTAYLAKLEERDRFVFFVRPRRFGKSLFISMMQAYYDRREKADFEKLFGGLWIGEHPTANRNRYLVLPLDFSKAGATGGRSLQECFEAYLSECFDGFIANYPDVYDATFRSEFLKKGALERFVSMTKCAQRNGFPIYLIIDEYDNFTNTLMRSAGKESYRSITHGTGFYREWFKKFKGSVDRIFMTGVSPVTMDDLTSGFNIAANISQDEDFNAMLGFTAEDTLAINRDFKDVGKYLDGEPEKIVRSIKPWYDGYCFAREKIGKESVFNSDMVLYHLKSMVAKGRPPENMVDRNIATDYNKLETIVELQRQAGAQNVEDVNPLTEELAATGEIPFELVESFPAEAIVEPENFRSLFHYYGILSMAERRKGMTYFKIPNACVEQQLFNYLRDSYRRVKLPDWIGWSMLASGMAYDGAWEPFLRRLADDFANTTPIRGDISGEIRLQGYMQAEFGHIRYYLAKPEMELSRGYCDFCLFPGRVCNGDVRDSYIVELKYSKPGASDAEIAAKAEEGIAQLRRYAADPTVPVLSADTRLHLILYQFQGTELIRLEEVAP
ncbi:MAG: AAA family ATPase, partial [bacterium]|nr:AAA family ATPase [Candidatus Colisoma equi]